MAGNESLRGKESMRGAWLGILGNVGLALLKGMVGYLAGSRAMVADALHSAADLVGSFVVLIALRVANQPADWDHPYGHGKAESLAAAAVGLVLLTTALAVMVASGRDMAAGASGIPGVAAVYVAGVSVVIKEAMFQYKVRLARRWNSPALHANAWEHRSDAFSSAAALVGIAGARMGYPFMDPLAAVVVALMVGRMGYLMVRDAVWQLMDRLPDEEVRWEMVEAAAAVNGVQQVQRILVRTMGGYLLADVTIAVPSRMNVAQGHDVAAQVRQSIQNRRDDVMRVMVHVNPADEG